MQVRREVQDLVDAGPFPAEDHATEEQLVTIQQRLDRIAPPVTDAEARALTAAFGPDDCYGLGWSLLHLIETAPGAPTADPPAAPENPWAQLLTARAQRGRRGPVRRPDRSGDLPAGRRRGDSG